MIFEYLPNLTNLADYWLNLDLYSLTNLTAISFSDVPFEFTEFQFHILRLFAAAFVLITFLIAVYWKKYGEVISERFIRPSEYIFG